MQFQPTSLLHAAALMFVAYTGYGRIATLGEEVIEPHRTIPKAIVLSLIISMLIYITVAIVGVGVAGADGLQAATTMNAAPLEVVSRNFPLRVNWLVSIGAMTALLGVLLNLLLGLSRVVLAMGRRGDMPSIFSNVAVFYRADLLCCDKPRRAEPIG
jgi:APA family basic amino acid/polyamine antiporter